MRLKNLLLALTIILSVASCSKKSEPTPTPPVPPPPTTPNTYVPDNSFKIVAYMPGYQDPELIDIGKYKMITHLFFAFLTINSAGDGTLNSLTATEIARFTAVGNRARSNGVKFGISVSGTSAYFVAMAKNETYRAKFITNVVAFAKANNVDGVDLDWEYPSTANSSADDFVLLMRDLSAALHAENKFLSAAVTPAVYSGKH